jgi:hypothetical protein
MEVFSRIFPEISVTSENVRERRSEIQRAVLIPMIKKTHRGVFFTLKSSLMAIIFFESRIDWTSKG